MGQSGYQKVNHFFTMALIVPLNSTYQVAEDHSHHTVCNGYARLSNLKYPHHSNSIGHRDAQTGSNNGKNSCWLSHSWCWEKCTWIWCRCRCRCRCDFDNHLAEGGASHTNNNQTGNLHMCAHIVIELIYNVVTITHPTVYCPTYTCTKVCPR